jgi:serine protease
LAFLGLPVEPGLPVSGGKEGVAQREKVVSWVRSPAALHQTKLKEERTMKKAIPVVALLIAVVLVAGALPTAYAEPAERVFIEYAPGKGPMVRNVVQAAGGHIHFAFDSINTIAVSISGRAANRLARNPNVISIEPDPLRYLAAQTVPYGITAVQAPLAWDAGATGDGVKVCIIDTGFGAHHEDLQGLSVDGYSQVDDNWAFDGYGHGTHVAGTITAVDNNLGVIGVSPGLVDLFIVKIFDNAGEWVNKQHASNLMAAAQMCADNGSQIISMSLSGTQASKPEQKVFDALYAQGVLSIAAASNEGGSEYHYPASYDSVVSVAAIDEDNVVADFSQFNDQVELAAPGVGVLSTVPFVQNSAVTVAGQPYEALPMEYAPYGTVTGGLVDGGYCFATDPAADWTGKVVICSRGDATFAEKVTKVMDNGGAAAVVYNNVDEGAVSGTLGEEGDWIVAVGISKADGLTLLGYLGQDATVVSAAPELGSGYEAWNGTSMATPHVSGVAALLWSANPEWTNVQIREAMDMTALDLGDPGRDVYYGYGLVQAKAALDYLLPPEP